MKTVLVTGSKGFIGKNLVFSLKQKEQTNVKTFDSTEDISLLEQAISQSDIIYHLAGVNRPREESEFQKCNFGLTEKIVSILEKQEKKVPIVLTSSTQASRSNPYGLSKKAAEECLMGYSRRTATPVCVYRLPGVFGKWSRPAYNTVVATFCHNIARGLPVSISDPEKEIELVYIDDVVQAFLTHLDAEPSPRKCHYKVKRTFFTRLGELSEKIKQLKDINETQVVPDLGDDFMKYLHATYLSFLPVKEFSSPVKLYTDNRGWLFELLKSTHFGQIFVSKTLPGITRGNHYHNTKLEKFCLIQGQGLIRFKHIPSGEILEYPVNDENIHIVDIPPGYAHSIENVGGKEMIVLFWANQIFDKNNPDTYSCEVTA